MIRQIFKNIGLKEDSFQLNKELISLVGVEAAVLYCGLLSEYIELKEKRLLANDGYFHLGIDRINDLFGLGKNRQGTAIERLEKAELIKIEKRENCGKKNKKYFKVITDTKINREYTNLLNEPNMHISLFLGNLCPENNELFMTTFNGLDYYTVAYYSRFGKTLPYLKQSSFVSVFKNLAGFINSAILPVDEALLKKMIDRYISNNEINDCNITNFCQKQQLQSLLLETINVYGLNKIYNSAETINSLVKSGLSYN